MIHKVIMNKTNFEPRELKIKKGDEVVFVNTTKKPHTINPYCKKLIGPERAYLHKFEKAGLYNYSCAVYEKGGMKGTIIVEE